jgi:hypothetical protein
VVDLRLSVWCLLASVAALACDVADDGLRPGAIAPPPRADDAGPRASTELDARAPVDVARSEPTVGISSTPPPVMPDAAAPPPDAAPPPPDAAPLPPDAPPPAPPPTADPAGMCPQGPDLALCLRFEGAVVDESQYRHKLVASGVGFAAGPAGMAASVGVGSEIVVPESAAFDSDAVTIEAWVQPRAIGRTMGIVDRDNRYSLSILGSGSVMCSGFGDYALQGSVMAAGVWRSVACTFDSGAITLYVDGVNVKQVSAKHGLGGGGPTGLNVGASNPSREKLDGLIDNVRVWRSVRTPQQVCAAARNCR